MSNRRHGREIVPENDSRWPKLEKIWIDEKLNCELLSERFGITVTRIRKYLLIRYGTASAVKYISTL